MKKNILFISNRLDFGGAEIYVISIANRLINYDYNVFAASSGGNLVQKLDKCIKHFEIPADAKKFDKIISCSIKLNKILKEYKIDLIHTNSVITCLIAKLATLFMKVKIINTAHSWGTNKKPLSAKIVNTCANKVVAVSNSTAQSYIDNGLNKNKTITIHNGIDTDKFKKLTETENISNRKKLNLSENDFVIINIARMEELRKGHDTLIEGAKIVIEKYPQAKFLLVGDGELKNGLLKKVSAYNIENNVIFLGNRTDVNELLSLSDIFCLPSDWEGLPLVIAEAMSCGLPVVATAVNGVPEIVLDEENGFLINPKEPEKLAEKIIYLIENPDKTNEFSIKCKERIKNYFSLNNLVNELIKLY